MALVWQLRALERAAGRPIHELFDLIGGVSTGGIIALGLSRGVPLAALEQMYYEIGARVFGTQSTVRGESTVVRRLAKHVPLLPIG